MIRARDGPAAGASVRCRLVVAPRAVRQVLPRAAVSCPRVTWAPWPRAGDFRLLAPVAIAAESNAWASALANRVHRSSAEPSSARRDRRVGNDGRGGKSRRSGRMHSSSPGMFR